MKTIRTTASILALTLAAFVSTSGQQPVAPPPKPADSGPSLKETMQFIQAKLSELGKMHYDISVYFAEYDKYLGQYYITIEYRNIVADSSTCLVSYHWKHMANDMLITDSDVKISLHDVQELVVRTGEQDLKKADADAGRPPREPRADPPVFVLVVRTPGKTENKFFFTDEDMANRVAKSMVHAVELCGGGNKDPF